MQSAFAALGLGLTFLAQTIGTRPSDIYREEFRRQPETARISKEFSGEAWVALLYASRLESADQADSSADRRIDNELEALRAMVKTDGEWLFWYRLQDYRITNPSSKEVAVVSGLERMPDANACRSELMVALRAGRMTALMPDCEPDQSSSPKRRP